MSKSVKRRVQRIEKRITPKDVKEPVEVLHSTDTGSFLVATRDGQKHKFGTKPELDAFLEKNQLHVGILISGWGLGDAQD